MTRRQKQKESTATERDPQIQGRVDDTTTLNIESMVSKPSMVINLAKSDDHKTAYANHARIGVSQWDFTVIFGQAIENKEAQSIIEEYISIKFSPQYLKSFANTLMASVQQWEATFGEIHAGLGQGLNLQGMNAVFEGLKGILENAEQPPKT
jgi:hypothetical protein